MPDSKVTDLTSAGTLDGTEVLYAVKDPSGTPLDRKTTAGAIKTLSIGAGSVSIASGKTFTASNTLTLAGTDSTTMTFPSTSATLARTDAGNTFTGAQTFSVGTVNGTGLDITQTWTGTGTYTGLKYNVGTDSGPANAASLLLDLQVGGNSQLSVSKAGTGLFAGAVRVYGGSGQFEIYSSSALSTRSFYAYDGGAGSTTVALGSGGIIGWGSTSAAGADSLILRRAAAATLQLGAADAAAPVAQFFKVQSGTAGASATTVSISGTSLTIAGTVTGTIAIGHAVTGTGVSAGTLITAGSGTSWTVNNSQTVGPITAYFNSVGADFTIRGSQGSGPSAGGSIIFQVAPAGSAATTAQNAYQTAFQINGNGGVTGQDGVTANTLALRNGTNAQRFNVYNTYTSSTNYETFKIDWITTANTCLIGTEKGSGGGTARALALQTDGTTRASWAANGVLTFNGNASYTIDQFNNFNWGFNQITGTDITANILAIGTGGSLPVLLRDAAYTLGLRNGNNGQIFNVYGRYTSATNFERWFVEAPTTSAATVLIGTQKGSGGGLARALAFQTDGTTRLTIETNGDLTIADAENIIVGSTTGTKIGTATSQKIGFWNATPIVQPTTGVAEAAFVENSGGTAVNVDSTFGGYTLQQVVQALQNAGLLA